MVYASRTDNRTESVHARCEGDAWAIVYPIYAEFVAVVGFTTSSTIYKVRRVSKAWRVWPQIGCPSIAGQQPRTQVAM